MRGRRIAEAPDGVGRHKVDGGSGIIILLQLKRGGVAKAKGEGEKEKECTTECKSRRR